MIIRNSRIKASAFGLEDLFGDLETGIDMVEPLVQKSLQGTWYWDPYRGEMVSAGRDGIRISVPYAEKLIRRAIDHALHGLYE